MTSTDQYLEAARTAIEKQDYALAEKLLREINRESSTRNFRSLELLGAVLEARKNLTQALDAFQDAESAATDSSDKIRLLAKILGLLKSQKTHSKRDIETMVACLEKSMVLDPGQDKARLGLELCGLYQALGNFREVLNHADRVREYPEGFVAGTMWAARACFLLEKKGEGLERLAGMKNRVGSLSQADLYAYLELLLKYRSFDDAQDVINSVRNMMAPQFWLYETQARLFSETGNHKAVLSLLSEDFIEACGDKVVMRAMYGLRAKSLEAQKEYSTAFPCFVRMNELSRQVYGKPPGNFIESYKAMALDDLPACSPSDTDPYVPVFMIGFPRSGTTLLDTILDTQKTIHTLSEVDGIGAARIEMMALGKQYPEGLADLTYADIQAVKQSYFGHNAQYIAEDAAFSVLIDKLPLNILYIPLIKVLFPEAKFILSLRHPLDVCLSCFQQDFQLNDAMVHFASLEGCFNMYRDVMALFGRYQAALQIDIHVVRYESLVGDLDKTAQSVFDFLNVEPDEHYREFHQINAGKLSNTPSQAQVLRPVHGNSKNRWKNYADELGPYIPVIQPAMEKLGYDI